MELAERVKVFPTLCNLLVKSITFHKHCLAQLYAGFRTHVLLQPLEIKYTLYSDQHTHVDEYISRKLAAVITIIYQEITKQCFIGHSSYGLVLVNLPEAADRSGFLAVLNCNGEQADVCSSCNTTLSSQHPTALAGTNCQ